MFDLLEIVQRLHQQDIIHRDIKPDNIIYRNKDYKVVLIDFGTAKKKGRDEIYLNKQTGVFTPDYAPIELRSKPQFNSDIYPIGIIAIEALTGLSPSEFEYDDQGEITWQPKIKITPKLKEIINKMVKQNYRHRYKTVQEVISQLNKLDQELSSEHELDRETSNNHHLEKHHKFIPSPTKPINNNQNLARNELDHLLNHLFSGLLILIVILLIPSFLIKSGVLNLPQHHPIEETE
jgi:serine/threonine protein kinase